MPIIRSICRFATVALLLVAVVLPAFSHSYTPTEEFVAYMKSVLNPHAFGLQAGRYYPYSTRYGRRIGYGLPVVDKALYRRGETPGEADQRLRTELAATLSRLDAFLAERYSTRHFEGLPAAAWEILLDRAFTDGVENLPPAFCEAVFQCDGKALIGQYLYVRAPDGWPDSQRNRAFARRWIADRADTQVLFPPAYEKLSER